MRNGYFIISANATIENVSRLPAETLEEKLIQAHEYAGKGSSGPPL